MGESTEGKVMITWSQGCKWPFVCGFVVLVDWEERCFSGARNGNPGPYVCDLAVFLVAMRKD